MRSTIFPNATWFHNAAGIAQASTWPGRGWYWLRPGWAPRQNLDLVVARANAGEPLVNDPAYGLGALDVEALRARAKRQSGMIKARIEAGGNPRRLMRRYRRTINRLTREGVQPVAYYTATAPGHRGIPTELPGTGAGAGAGVAGIGEAVATAQVQAVVVRVRDGVNGYGVGQVVNPGLWQGEWVTQGEFVPIPPGVTVAPAAGAAGGSGGSGLSPAVLVGALAAVALGVAVLRRGR